MTTFHLLLNVNLYLTNIFLKSRQEDISYNKKTIQGSVTKLNFISLDMAWE